MPLPNESPEDDGMLREEPLAEDEVLLTCARCLANIKLHVETAGRKRFWHVGENRKNFLCGDCTDSVMLELRGVRG